MTDTPLPRGTIAALSLAAFGSAIAVRVTDPLLPDLASEFGVPLGEAADVITVFSIAYGVSQLFFGPVGDRFGKYRVIAWTCLAGGLGFYMLHNTLQINATQMAPERRGAAVSIFACCFFFGQSVGVCLAGLGVAHLGTANIIVLGAGVQFARLKRRG